MTTEFHGPLKINTEKIGTAGRWPIKYWSQYIVKIEPFQRIVCRSHLAREKKGEPQFALRPSRWGRSNRPLLASPL